MKHLPYIDEHAIAIGASRERMWKGRRVAL